MSGVPSDVVVQSSSVLLDRVTVVALTVSPRCGPAQPWFQLGLEDEPTVRWPPTDRSWCGLAASAAVSSRGQPARSFAPVRVVDLVRRLVASLREARPYLNG